MVHENIQLTHFVVGEVQSNVYILSSKSTKECYIIDPGDEASRIIDYIESSKLKPAGIILTHGHLDHCGAVSAIKEVFPVSLILHEDDEDLLQSPLNQEFSRMLRLPMPPPADKLVKEGDVIKLGEANFRVIHTPGHTPGSMCLHWNSWLFSGDTLFAGSIGRTDFPGGDFNILKDSLNRLKELDPDTIVYPGHMGDTTIRNEKMVNPFFH
jgi:glyoxylase-like metal-dependent hydrolase (beta-lactamase superfamily II)